MTLVTGAASGLGLATAKAFSESGTAVTLADWNEKELQAAAKKMADKGFETDLTVARDRARIQSAHDSATEIDAI